YLLYRHYSNDPRSKKLPRLICSLLRLLAASILTEKGDFTFADQVELARAFSAEIEYSDVNMDILLSNL
ncbi:MAG: hypothetical protein IJN42_04250, partial [Clostridia bacterium]|nr:hypothetical protein [Clostridia bacterium]